MSILARAIPGPNGAIVCDRTLSNFSKVKSLDCSGGTSVHFEAIRDGGRGRYAVIVEERVQINLINSEEVILLYTAAKPIKSFHTGFSGYGGGFLVPGNPRGFPGRGS